MTGKTIRVKPNTHSTFFSLLKKIKAKSSDECLMVLLIYYYDNHSIDSNLEGIYKGMYQIEEKS